MGQALREFDVRENYTRKYLELIIRNKENTIRNNNHNNDDYDIDIIKRKSNALREYLDKTTGKVNKPMENSNGKTKSKYIGVNEAAEYTNKTTKTIRNWIKAGMPHTTVNGKHFISIETLEIWKVRKYEKIKFTPESTDGKDSEPVDNSVSAEITHTEIYQPENNSPQPIQIIDVGRNYMAEVEEKINHALSEQQKYFEKLLAQQQELTVSMFEELKREKDMEKKEVLTVIENVKNDSYSNAENILKEYEWIKKQNEDILAAQSKRSWWKFWKK